MDCGPVCRRGLRYHREAPLMLWPGRNKVEETSGGCWHELTRNQSQWKRKKHSVHPSSLQSNPLNADCLYFHIGHFMSVSLRCIWKLQFYLSGCRTVKAHQASGSLVLLLSCSTSIMCCAGLILGLVQNGCSSCRHYVIHGVWDELHPPKSICWSPNP